MNSTEEHGKLLWGKRIVKFLVKADRTTMTIEIPYTLKNGEICTKMEHAEAMEKTIKSLLNKDGMYVPISHWINIIPSYRILFKIIIRADEANAYYIWAKGRIK